VWKKLLNLKPADDDDDDDDDVDGTCWSPGVIPAE